MIKRLRSTATAGEPAGSRGHGNPRTLSSRRPISFRNSARGILRALALMAGGLIASSPILAQDQSGPLSPRFEVASVKPAAPGQGIAPGDCAWALAGVEFHCASMPLKYLLLSAYDLREDQLVGPSWLATERYAFAARAPAGATNEQLPAMMRQLLEERFGMVTHWETREMPVYELTVAKGGSKLRPPAPAAPAAEGAAPAARMLKNEDGLPEFPPGAPHMLGTNVGADVWLTARMESIASLLRFLQSQIGRPVVDKTGLTGVYDFNLRWARPSAAPDAQLDTGLDLFGAFEKQLGLKLTSAKGPVKFLVVDEANKTPAEN